MSSAAAEPMDVVRPDDVADDVDDVEVDAEEAARKAQRRAERARRAEIERREEVADLAAATRDFLGADETGGGRRRRGAARGASKDKEMLAALRAAKHGAVSRSEQYVVEDKGQVYDMVDEDEYKELVETRRKNNWIDDDDGAGYANDEEDDWGAAENRYAAMGDDIDQVTSGVGERLIKRASKTPKYGNKKLGAAFRDGDDDGATQSKLAKKARMNERKRAAELAANNNKITTMFKSRAGMDSKSSVAAARAAAARKREKVTNFGTADAGDRESDKLMEQLLSNLDDESAAGASARGSTSTRILPPQLRAGPGAAARKKQPVKKRVRVIERVAAQPRQYQQQAEEYASYDNDGEPMDDGEPMEVVSAAKASAGRPRVSLTPGGSAIVGKAEEADEDEDGPKELVTLDEDAMPEAAPTTNWWEEDEAKEAEAKAQAEAEAKARAEAKNASLAASGLGSVPQLDRSATLTLSGTTTARQTSAPVNEKNQVKFYWMDAYEDKRNAPGKVFLYGKVKMPSGDFVSACVEVRNIMRKLFVAPRDPAAEAEGTVGGEDDDDVALNWTEDQWDEMEDEFIEYARNFGVTKIRTKVTKPKFNFNERGVATATPRKFLKAVYAADQPELPSTGKAGGRFGKILGTSTTCLEHFLLSRKIKGPQWLTVDMDKATPASVPNSWCKVELVVEDPKDVHVLAEDANLPSPPVTVLTLDVKTVANKAAHEIMLVTGLVRRDVSMDGPTEDGQTAHFSIVRKYKNQWPHNFDSDLAEANVGNVEKRNTERELLIHLTVMFSQIDPDVIVGHNALAFHLDVLLHRFQANNVRPWSKLGRMRRTNLPKMHGAAGSGDSAWALRMATAGRLVCDTYLSAKEFLRERNYSLTELAQTQLKVQTPHVAIEFGDIPRYYEADGGLVQLIRLARYDAWLSQQLMFHLMLIPLTKQLTNICGNLWARTMSAGRAERVEHLLLHSFKAKGFILPDKEFAGKKKSAAAAADADEDDGETGLSKKSTKGRRKAAYAGGLVLEPERGLHDSYVLLIDFKSLYPSIIQEFNICFMTVAPPEADDDGTVPLAALPDKEAESMLPRIVEGLLVRRGAVKRALKDEVSKGANADQLKVQQYDIRQKAFKLVANSMYGCLGFTHSRFYAKDLAQLITSQGRKILQDTKKTVEALNYSVIYGDTDSIMISTGLTEYKAVLKIGNDIKRAINQEYRKLELDIDGVFERILLLRKKKYAAVMLEADGSRKIEMKGLDLVRRDWCVLSRRMGEVVLGEILAADKTTEDIVTAIHTYLREMADKMRNGELKLEDYVITKGLTKAPEDYPDGKGQPHVQVALRMMKAGKIVRAGEHIPYVICKGDESSAANRAHHPDELRAADSALELDIDWYMQQQIHPPVSRLCDVIEGTNAGQIATCLGLDAAKYKSTSRDTNEDEFYFAGAKDDEDKFADVEKLVVRCPACTEESIFLGLKQTPPVIRDPTACPACRQQFPMPALANTVTRAIRAVQAKFYDLVFECTECQNVTRQVSVRGAACLFPGCDGTVRPALSSKALYTQILYYKALFDVDNELPKLRDAVAEANKKITDGTPHTPLPDLAPEQQHLMRAVAAVADDQLSRCGYAFINLERIFEPLHLGGLNAARK